MPITVAITLLPAHGPSSTPASTPPRRWPLVPAATGKLNICAAKMNAPAIPMRTVRAVAFVRSTAFRRRVIPITTAVATQSAIDTSGARKPSGICRFGLMP